ncbi:FAD:protein FMN transferase [Aestuariirhabdus sp. Z084]|uniref:FAD:protein FMN transferase n=1 Tax=Aestuariirhabdus haliotis TaxID=2918751 RepID=UPI00201B3EDC|nr:FAD:protein FMN transferase [Aestuariirhabdus haliotis]MCL6414770.1 FAD:protein FMN transferase [Aestuariirhabdus haliotis]MCL6418702.1 FAD:protein FMN transferase [Aestuariirhabdus haliotis]
MTQPVISIVLLAQLFIAGCSFEERAEVHSLEGLTMGTSYNVKYVANPQLTKEQISLAAKTALDDVDQRMSTYRNDSELMRFNALPSGSELKVSPDLIELVQISQYLSGISDGAYDVTVGPLVNLWGFGPDKRPEKTPTAEQIAKVRGQVGYQYLIVDPELNVLRKERPLFVDLSAIAKGYGVDRVAAEIELLGVQSYLVEVGGEVRMKGLKPDGSSWKIGVEKPSLGERQASLIISADNKGIATSGDYRNYFEVDGTRYSHTIDPRTGYPINHTLVSVTVIDDSTAMADGLATLFMALGTNEGIAVAQKEKIAALFVEKEGGEFRYTSTTDFDQYVLNKPE